MVAAAIGGAALAGVAGSAVSSSASKSAANTQAQAQDQASQNALAQYDQTRQDLQPYQIAGEIANGSLLSTLGLPGGTGINLLANNGINSLAYQTPGNIASILSNPQFNPTQAQLEATPGYQFDLNQGLQATQNSNAAQGLGVSGAALKGAANYATGLANNTLSTQAGIFQNNYSNALQQNQQGQGIFQSNLGNVLNSLSGLTNLGQNAAATTGQQGVAAVGNANNLAVGGANAQAAGQVGAANALSGGLNSLGNAGTNYMLYNQLLGGGAGAGTGSNSSSAFGAF